MTPPERVSCCLCGGPIEDGELFIILDDGEQAHEDCALEDDDR